ncbi:MAG TPA: hypothetical protein VF787_21255 [Thermoanaerobaculia bacterium]
MTEVTLHPTPQWRDVAREQIRTIGLSLRREAMIAAIVVGIVTLIIAIDIASDNATTWFDSDEWVGVGFLSFLFPFAVWRRERRFGPAFLWTLPVDRRQLALTKVLAGWVWLMAALMSMIVWQRTLAMASGVANPETVPLIAFGGATAMYLLGSALVLGLRHPLRWLLGTVGVFFLLATLNEALGRTDGGQARMFAWSGPVRWAIYGPYGIDTLLSSTRFKSAVHDATAIWRKNELVSWAIAMFVWLGAGFGALWAAASRHGDRRRQ